jgi:hypothetical protein
MVHPFCPRAPKAFRRKSRLERRPDYHLEDPDRISVEGFANIRHKYFSLIFHSTLRLKLRAQTARQTPQRLCVKLILICLIRMAFYQACAAFQIDFWHTWAPNISNSAIRKTVRSWNLSRRTSIGIEELANQLNPTYPVPQGFGVTRTDP